MLLMTAACVSKHIFLSTETNEDVSKKWMNVSSLTRGSLWGEVSWTIPPLPPLWLLLGSSVLTNTHLSMKVSYICAISQEVTRPKARFKSTLPEMSEVDGGNKQLPIYLGQSPHLNSPWWFSLAIITSDRCISGVCPGVNLYYFRQSQNTCTSWGLEKAFWYLSQIL